MTSNNNNNKETESARAAARGTLWSFVFKLLSFSATQWTLKTLDPVVLGKASIQLELMLSTLLFLSREGFRLVVVKPNSDFQVAYMSIPVSFCITILALTTFYYSSNADLDYRLAGVLYCMASWIEGWAEPTVLWLLRNLQLYVKARAEGISTIVKTCSLVVLLPLLPNYPICAFGISQLLYATTYTLLILYHSTSSLPPWNYSFPYNSSTLHLVIIFTIQGIFKHVLTEGDRIILTSYSNYYHQGMYAMASAYGGIAARLLFQPMEENARLLWTRRPTHPTSYTTCIHVVLHVGCVFSTIAVNYTGLLLRILAGRKWGNNAQAATVLSAFCVYTAFLAWNGMTEAFLYGVVSSGGQVSSLGVAHVVVGLGFMGMAPLLVAQYGTVGLVAANCVAMAARACYSVYFASKYFCQYDKTTKSTWAMAKLLLRDMFPPPIVLLTYAMAFVVTRVSLLRMREYELENAMTAQGKITREWLVYAALHVAVGIASALVVAMSTYWWDRHFWQSLVRMFREKQE